MLFLMRLRSCTLFSSIYLTTSADGETEPVAVNHYVFQEQPRLITISCKHQTDLFIQIFEGFIAIWIYFKTAMSQYANEPV